MMNYSAYLNDIMNRTENAFNKINSKNDNVISLSDVTDTDVLCGRGAPINKHPGNVYFRKVVQCNKELYKISKKDDRICIAESIVTILEEQSPPTRFLEQLYDKIRGMVWIQISKERAIRKIFQALRERSTVREEADNDNDAKSFISSSSSSHKKLKRSKSMTEIRKIVERKRKEEKERRKSEPTTFASASRNNMTLQTLLKQSLMTMIPPDPSSNPNLNLPLTQSVSDAFQDPNYINNNNNYGSLYHHKSHLLSNIEDDKDIILESLMDKSTSIAKEDRYNNDNDTGDLIHAFDMNDEHNDHIDENNGHSSPYDSITAAASRNVECFQSMMTKSTSNEHIEDYMTSLAFQNAFKYQANDDDDTTLTVPAAAAAAMAMMTTFKEDS